MSKAPGSPLQPHWTRMSSDDKAEILRQLGSLTWQAVMLTQVWSDRITLWRPTWPSDQDLPGARTAGVRILQLSRPMWLISRLLSFDTVVDYPVLNDLWVITNSNKGHLLEEFKIRQSQDTYMGVHALLKEDDDHSRAAEEKHFKKRTQVDLTVARELTLISQWSSRYGQHGFLGLRVESSAFKTGEALWKWIDRCMIDLQEMYGWEFPPCWHEETKHK